MSIGLKSQRGDWFGDREDRGKQCTENTILLFFFPPTILHVPSVAETFNKVSY